MKDKPLRDVVDGMVLARMKSVVCLFLFADCILSTVYAAVDYPIVYARFPRAGDDTRIEMPEVFDPISVPPGVDLMLLHPDGFEEVLVPGGDGAIIDPVVSFDGLWIYYAQFHDQRPEARDRQRPGHPSRAGADLYKINVQTREIVRLTFQEWTPNSGLVTWSNNHLSSEEGGPYYIGYGIFNLGPCPLPGGRIMFTSSRNTFLPNNDFTAPNLQLYVMDNDGRNVELVGHMNLGSALHPTILTDGRVMFSSYEAQGLRDRRVWGLWAIWPDGRNWEPLVSAFDAPTAFHFQTELPNRDLAVVAYYNANNNGFGSIYAFPPAVPENFPKFGSPIASDPSNLAIERGIWWFDDSHPSHKKPRYARFSFSPYGIYSLSAFSHAGDNASSRDLGGGWAGKVTHPAGAPHGDTLVVWTPGPANNLNRPTDTPTYDGGLYLIENSQPIDDHQDLVFIRNDPDYNELQPRAVVPYQSIYGIDEPTALPWYQNDGDVHEALPAGTPFGLVGTSTFYRRDTTPGKGKAAFDGLDPFNTAENGASSNWGGQGADAGLYDNSEIYAVRILAMEPTTHLGRGPGIGNSRVRGYYNHAQERLRILGEVPLRKEPNVSDVNGDPDTSFMAKIPADTPFTFQTIDKDGLVLNMSQTWHQLRPGEVRNDCGGCHSHSQMPTPFAGTAASQPDYHILNLALSTPVLSKDTQGETVVVDQPERAIDVEYYRDIKPILQRSCVACHSLNGRQEAGLVLDDESIVDGYENTYNRLCRDAGAQYGIKPVISSKTWRQTNASRYVRKFQSRRSLLIWKIFGRRLDGWTNADHPTESVPGDATTLPEGAKANEADIDFTGTIMPPPDAEVPPLTEDEKLLFARWIDLGAPIDSPDAVKSVFGWFADDLRPTLTIALPARGRTLDPLEEIRLGAFDYYSGLNRESYSIVADFEVNGHAAGEELASLFSESGDHIWTLSLQPAITSLQRGTLTVSVEDHRGNSTTVQRTFSIGPETTVPELMPVGSPEESFPFRVVGEPQASHMIEVSQDLDEWEPWMTIQDFDGDQTILDPEVDSLLQRFYRVVRLPDAVNP